MGMFKGLAWVGSAKHDLKAMPAAVQDEIGCALHLAQAGAMPANAKPLHGFSGVSVMEIVENFQTNTYRGIYTVKFAGIVYVLHCFVKKSKHGSAMTQQDKELLRTRLKVAEQDYRARQEGIA